MVSDVYRRRLVKAAGNKYNGEVFEDLTDQEKEHMTKARAEFKQKGVAGLVEQGTISYRQEVRKCGGDHQLLGSDVSHIYAKANGGCNHAMNYIMCGANFNRAFGQYHDPVVAYIAGAARTMTAYLISCHFAEDDGDDLVEPQELYLAGKNAVYKSKETAMAFMRALNE